MSDTANQKSGGAWAALLAAGAGCAVFAILVDLCEWSAKISQRLNFYNPVGDLSGKSILAVVIWLALWAMLHVRWKNRDIGSPGLVAALAIGLVVFAIAATFPPVFGILVR